MFDSLNSVLLAYRLKPISTASVERESDPTKPCIVFFSELEKKVALLLSAAKILPENVFVVSETSWIKVLKQKGQNVLYILEGITANEFGQCFYVKFKTPQKVTFLCNFLTEEKFSFSQPVFQQEAQQFQVYERLATCPISSGVELNEYTDDKLHTRLLAVSRNIEVPTTAAFCFSLDKYYHHHLPSSQIQLLDISRNISLEEIREYLRVFPFNKFVVKPSGARWMGGRSCTIESKDNLDLAIENFKNCLDFLWENESLLVEEFIDSSLKAYSPLGARLRIFVTRRPNNIVETSGILCHLGDIAQPINGDTSESFSIDYLCNFMGLTEDQKNQLIARLNKLGKTVLESVIEYENQYITHIPANKQTDFIGLDIFLKNQQGQLEPFLIEVNNHDCISTLQLYEVQHSPHRTTILDKWVETMLYRSYQYMLKDNNILMIGGAGKEKFKKIEWSNALRINLILCESEPHPYPLSYYPKFLGIDLDKFQDNLEKALAIIQEVRRCQIDVNGIVTHEKTYLALANLVAIFLGKSANSYESASLAQSQLLTQQKILVNEFNKMTFEARKFSYGVTFFSINCLQDIQNIPLDYYPLSLQIEPEVSSFVSEIVTSQKQLLASFDRLQTVLPPGMSLGCNYRLIAIHYPNGIPQDVLLIMSEGELIAGYLIPPLSNRQDLAQNKTEILPNFLARERQENLIYASWKSCYNLGLKEGIFYIKGVFTDLGAKILDIQVCPWQDDLIQWLFNVWDINPILYSYLIACGFKPFVNKNSQPRL